MKERQYILKRERNEEYGESRKIYRTIEKHGEIEWQ
jgi:hypothetical protein